MRILHCVIQVSLECVIIVLSQLQVCRVPGMNSYSQLQLDFWRLNGTGSHRILQLEAGAEHLPAVNHGSPTHHPATLQAPWWEKTCVYRLSTAPCFSPYRDSTVPRQRLSILAPPSPHTQKGEVNSGKQLQFLQQICCGIEYLFNHVKMCFISVAE